MRACDLARLLIAAHIHRDAILAFCSANAFGLEADLDALALENVSDRRRYVLVFACNKPDSHLHHRDAAAETAAHLRELESDVTSAHDDQMFRQNIDIHHARDGPVTDVV